MTTREKSSSEDSSPDPVVPEERIRQVLEGPCNLSVLRRVVDRAIAKWAPAAAGPIPNGYAGEIAAALWVHLQGELSALLAAPVEPPSSLHAIVDGITAEMNDEAMWEVNNGDKIKGGMLLRYVEELHRALLAAVPPQTSTEAFKMPFIPASEHVCHDMNPPSPGPCHACEIERAMYARVRHLVIARRLLSELRSLAPKYDEDARALEALITLCEDIPHQQFLGAVPPRQEEKEATRVDTPTERAGRPAPPPVSDAEVIAAVRGVLWDAMRGREIGGDRTLVGMVRALVAERDEARDNRRGEYELRIEAERQLHKAALPPHQAADRRTGKEQE